MSYFSEQNSDPEPTAMLKKLTFDSFLQIKVYFNYYVTWLYKLINYKLFIKNYKISVQNIQKCLFNHHHTTKTEFGPHFPEYGKTITATLFYRLQHCYLAQKNYGSLAYLSSKKLSARLGGLGE